MPSAAKPFMLIAGEKKKMRAGAALLAAHENRREECLALGRACLMSGREQAAENGHRANRQ